MVHAVHIVTAGLSGGWERSLAQIAHIPASQITAIVDRTVAQLLEKLAPRRPA
jgi:hypothetical protein